MAKFSDIPQFTREGSWECNFRLENVWGFIDEQRKADGSVDIDPDFFESFHVFPRQQVADFSSNTTHTKSLKQCRRGSHGYSAVFGGVA